MSYDGGATLRPLSYLCRLNATLLTQKQCYRRVYVLNMKERLCSSVLVQSVCPPLKRRFHETKDADAFALFVGANRRLAMAGM